MKLEEFEARYAKRSKMTVDEMHRHGLRAYRCKCEDPSCQGWQMLTEGGASTQVALGLMTPEDAAEGMYQEGPDR